MITVITPTADQQTGITLLEKFVARQTAKPDQWIVVDDGNVPCNLTMGQDHIVAPRQYEGAQSLAMNMIRAIPHITGDVIVVMEHDDYYQPDHIEAQLNHLEGFRMTGCLWQRYYNVSNRHFRVMENVGSSLCNTTFRADLLELFGIIAQRAFDRNKIGLDRMFWDAVSRAGHIHQQNTMIGIKGLPGRVGLGMGHKPPNSKWTHDPELKQLRAWIGDDADIYQEFG